MTDAAFDTERYLDAVAPTLGLTITPAQRPAVIRFLQIAQGMAARLERAPFDPDETELAPVFVPGLPTDVRA